MSTIKTATIAAVMIALLPASAYAQEHQPATQRSDAEKRQDAEIEKAYEKVMKGVNAQTPRSRYDPWGTVRDRASESAKKQSSGK
jgi:hypothetical protein